jgi:hypothetical protein
MAVDDPMAVRGSRENKLNSMDIVAHETKAMAEHLGASSTGLFGRVQTRPREPWHLDAPSKTTS